jgi:hypothetical protein
MSRQYTSEEVREQFLRKVASYVKYWENESRAVTTREKLEGLAFGMLVILDGGCPDLPAFKVIADPHPEDKDYCIDNEMDYFPLSETKEDFENNDIGGGLHEHIHKFFPPRP